MAGTEERAFEAETATREERIRQMDRVVDTLSNLNHDLRGKHLSLQGESHRLQEEAEHLNLASLNGSGAEREAQEQPGGEVTNITPLLKH